MDKQHQKTSLNIHTDFCMSLISKWPWLRGRQQSTEQKCGEEKEQRVMHGITEHDPDMEKMFEKRRLDILMADEMVCVFVVVWCLFVPEKCVCATILCLCDVSASVMCVMRTCAVCV